MKVLRVARAVGAVPVVLAGVWVDAWRWSRQRDGEPTVREEVSALWGECRRVHADIRG